MEVSISSLRADSLTEDLVASLQRGGHRTLTIAPEAGTERLRRVIRKVISDEQIFAACDLLRALRHPEPQVLLHDRPADRDPRGRRGHPGPRRAACSSGCGAGPDGHPFGKLTLSISSFVPKPWTPFQWAPFDDAARARGQARDHQAGGAGGSHRPGRAREPARGGACRPCSPAATGGSPTSSRWPRGSTATGGARSARWDGDPAFYTRRVRDVPETLPWDHFDVGVKKAGLLRRVAARRARRARRGHRVGRCASASRRPPMCRSGEGRVVEAGRPQRSRSSTWTAPSTPSTMPARTGAGPSGTATSTARSPLPLARLALGRRGPAPTPTTPRSRCACFPVTVERGRDLRRPAVIRGHRSDRPAPQSAPLRDRPVQPALQLLHARRGVRLAAPGGHPAVRGDGASSSTCSSSSAWTRCASPAASRCCGATSPGSSRMLAAQAAPPRPGHDHQRRAAGRAGAALRAAGLHRVTVSLDTLARALPGPHPPRHARPGAGGHRLVGRRGLPGLKLDTVVIRGVNDDELADNLPPTSSIAGFPGLPGVAMIQHEGQIIIPISTASIPAG